MKELILGNEAIARGAYESGVTVATAYPGTPSTEIIETISRYEEIYTEWAPNEKVALEVGIGAAYAGARTLVTMKHVGLNVAADPLFTVSYTGINGGLVIIVADDPGMHSSQNEQDSRYYARSAHIPMLEPADSQEAKDFIKIGFEISEEFDTPVLIRLTTRVSHSLGVVELKPRENVPLKDYKKDMNKYVMMPGMARKRHVFVEQRMEMLKELANNIGINRIEGTDNDIGLITSGIPYQYCKEAIKDARILKLGMVYPLPERTIKDFVNDVKQTYVVEELEPFFEEQIRFFGVGVIGKELFSRQGELSTKIVMDKLTKQETKKQELQDIEEEPIPLRPPVMCPGCPHRGVFHILNKLKLTVTGDIGCYTLGALPPLQAMDTCVCMGAAIGVALGMEKARGKEFNKNVVAVIGDSTFMHSGITGLIDVVYNKGNTTVIILDNSTTGMTGHQDHPGTGKTVKGESTHSIDLENLVKAIGVKRVRVVDPFDLIGVETMIKEELKIEEPSVIIAKRPCVLIEKPKSRKNPYQIDNSICKQCNMCLKIGCPAIMKSDNIMKIDPNQCSACSLCTKVCKFDAILEAGEKYE